ncbi:MAG: hypothetical protein CUN50_00985 [Candidatus Thermofonsia Clade 1 bacterium]|uniref:Lipoprotein LpqB beta-propeller domain-containing protein n=1 Tax=Candidatus Thermofonsia Clade 1 bacterium TaxID=2364210 RepID=A0A2M8Q0H5_9CHLR|nr:MAG: hypothetical protein CUN50_00985 [Candidatus Thermofonsia Clade 1 bacterium]
MLCALLLVSCAVSPQEGVAPSRFERRVPSQSAIALMATQRGAWIAWAGDLIAPDLYVQPVSSAQPWRFPISGVPTQISLLPLAERRLAVLWLEGSLGTATHLQCATLEPDGSLRRAPFDIGVAQRYSAIAAPDGSILAFTITDGVLSAVRLDRLGRPFSRQRLAEAAHLVAATLDQRDQLHVLWLRPSDGQLWQLLYMSFESALLDQSAPRLPAPTLLAVLRLADGAYFESLSISADSERLYVLWNAVSVSAEGESAQLAGLSFPLDAPLQSRALDLSALPGNLRAVRLLNVDSAPRGAPSLVGSLLPRQMIYGALTAQGVFRLGRLQAASNDEVLIGQAAALSENNALHLAWLAQDAQGRAMLRYVVLPRPQPSVAPS